jgi:hypothetical protein
VTACVFVSETLQVKITTSLGLTSPSLALLTFWLMTIVLQGAIWWVTVAVRERVDASPDTQIAEVPDLNDHKL